MKRVVISQPMFFPWRGIFEQIRLADTFVHYDDVQFSKGSFSNRVQVKTPGGLKWLTVPLKNLKLGYKINEVEIDDRHDWRKEHFSLLELCYKEAPFYTEMIELVNDVYKEDHKTLSDLAISSMMRSCAYFGFDKTAEFYSSSKIHVEGKSWQRVFDIVRKFGGDTYITGHGAKNYLDHEYFENNGIDVEYMEYRYTPYPQLHGDFTPFVSILDLVANTGKQGIEFIDSTTINWKKFIHERSKEI